MTKPLEQPDTHKVYMLLKQTGAYFIPTLVQLTTYREQVSVLYSFAFKTKQNNIAQWKY